MRSSVWSPPTTTIDTYSYRQESWIQAAFQLFKYGFAVLGALIQGKLSRLDTLAQRSQFARLRAAPFLGHGTARFALLAQL